MYNESVKPLHAVDIFSKAFDSLLDDVSSKDIANIWRTALSMISTNNTAKNIFYEKINRGRYTISDNTNNLWQSRTNNYI